MTSQIDETVLLQLDRRRDAFELSMKIAALLDEKEYYPESIVMALVAVFVIESDGMDEDSLNLFEAILENEEEGNFGLTMEEADGLVGYAAATDTFFRQQ